MSGVFVGFGRIIGVKYKDAAELGKDNSVMELSVSVNTGERKKEDMQYPPSNIYRVTIWGKRADALVPYAKEGRSVFFEGNLAVPTTYVTRDGDTRVQLSVVNVNDLKIVSVVYDDDLGTAATAKSTKKAEQPKVEEIDPIIEELTF